jgi:electron transport complex protein RnfG
VKANGEVVGYAVEAPSITRNGYADRIKLMVGFVENDGKTIINGIKVLKQSETPGLGANMTKEGNSLERSAVGKEPKSLAFAVSKEGGSFDALTGSTISSRAYANAVETAYAGYLWAKGELPSADDAKSGATKTNQEEPEAQKGEVDNE